MFHQLIVRNRVFILISSEYFYSVLGLSFLHYTAPLPTRQAFSGFAGARLPDLSDFSVIDILSDACWPSLKDRLNLHGIAWLFKVNDAGFPCAQCPTSLGSGGKVHFETNFLLKPRLGRYWRRWIFNGQASTSQVT
jgi:hypothetical protein